MGHRRTCELVDPSLPCVQWQMLQLGLQILYAAICHIMRLAQHAGRQERLDRVPQQQTRERPGRCLPRIDTNGGACRNAVSWLWGGETFLDGVLRQQGNVVNIEFLHHAQAMGLDRLGTDEQTPRDLFRAVALGYEL